MALRWRWIIRAQSLSIFALLLLTRSACAWQRTANHAADEAAIRQIWSRFEAAFNRGDAKTAASVYTADGDRMDSFGQFFQGREAIERSYVDLFAGPYKGGTTSSEIIKIQFVTPDVAFVELNSEVKGLQGSTEIRKLQATTIYVKRGGTWAIVAHRPRLRPPPAK